MHVALLKVCRRGEHAEIIAVNSEEELASRLDRLQASENTLRIYIFRPTETLTRKVTFTHSFIK